MRIVSAYLSAQEVAEVTGFARSTIYKGIECGEIRHVKWRGRIRVKREWLEEWADRNTVEPVAEVMPQPGRRDDSRRRRGSTFARTLDAMEGAAG